MTPRERVREAVTRGTPDKVPKEVSFTPSLLEKFHQETGSDDPVSYFGMEIRSVDFVEPHPDDLPDFSGYLRDKPAETRVMGEYGTMSVPANFYHFWGYVFPLIHAETAADIESYPWPDITKQYRHEKLGEQVDAWHDQGYFVTAMAGHIFETAWQLVGFERVLADMVVNPLLVEAVLERITVDNCFRARRFAEAGIDMLRTGDDVGMEDRLMMPPEVWRRLLKPPLAREIAAAREVVPDLPVWYHSDGDISLIIDDLIEVGVTVLNPVQPESMDVYTIQQKYGDRLAFWGTIGTQSTMPFGTSAEVKAVIKEMIELFAPGLVLAPTHVLEPDVPWENVLAFFEAIEEHGIFP